MHPTSLSLGRFPARSVTILFVVLSASLGAGEPDPRSRPEYPPQAYPREGQPVIVMEQTLPGELKIPAGHLPPPGSCRIWYPDRPAGHQPPPGDCEQLAARVPPGAWLLSRPAHDPENVYVAAYDRQQPGVLRERRVFNAETGRHLPDRDGKRAEHPDYERRGHVGGDQNKIREDKPDKHEKPGKDSKPDRVKNEAKEDKPDKDKKREKDVERHRDR